MQSIKTLRNEGFTVEPSKHGVDLVKLQAPDDIEFYYYNPRHNETAQHAFDAMVDNGLRNELLVPASSVDFANDRFPFVIVYQDQYHQVRSHVNAMAELQADAKRLQERMSCMAQMQGMYKRELEK